MTKNEAKAKQILKLNFCYLKIICFLYPRYHPKIILDILKKYKKQTLQFRCLYWKWGWNWKTDHIDTTLIELGQDMDGHKHTKYKMCLSIIMVIYIKQHLSNIWNSIHEKVKQHWAWVEKSVTYKNTVEL